MITSSFCADLTIYSSRKEHLIKDLLSQYEKENGVKVNLITGKAGALIERMKLEGKNSPADIFMTVDAGNLWFAGKEGLLTKLNSKKLEQTIPSQYRDLDNQWFGLSVRARTMVFNKTKVQSKDLSTYASLADKKWKGRLCLRTSKKVYNQSLVSMLIFEHGKVKAQKIVEGWMKNTVKIHSNDTSVIKAIASGQCDVGIVNSYYLGRILKKNPDYPVAIHWANQKNFGTHVNISGAGVTKASKHKKQAQHLLEWFTSNKSQKSLAAANLEYSVNSKVSPGPLLEKWGSFKSNRSFNLTKAGELQKEAIKLMYDANYK